MAALRDAGTVVCEPIHPFHLEVPDDSQGAVLAALGKLQATLLESAQRGHRVLLAGDVPAGAVHRMQHPIPRLTRGEGYLSTALDHFRPVRGEPPSRPRTDNDPTDRTGYLRRLTR